MSENLVLTALLGFWLPGMVALTLLWFFRRRERFTEYRVAGMRSDEVRQVQAELEFRLHRTIKELNDQVQRLEEFSKASRRELQGDLRRTMESFLDKQFSRIIATEISKSLVRHAPATPPAITPSHEEIVSDLAHSIKTPLAHIEATLREALATGTSDVPVREMINSVDLIKAVLAAFRQITRTSGEPDTWSPSDLQLALTAAHAVFNTTTGKKTGLRLISAAGNRRDI